MAGTDVFPRIGRRHEAAYAGEDGTLASKAGGGFAGAGVDIGGAGTIAGARLCNWLI